MFFSATSPHFLNTSRDGDSTTSLGSLFQCLSSLSEKKFFSISSLSIRLSGFQQLNLDERNLIPKIISCTNKLLSFILLPSSIHEFLHVNIYIYIYAACPIYIFLYMYIYIHTGTHMHRYMTLVGRRPVVLLSFQVFL